jgi:FtsP/CotA-like multicopper oxidase with cupredoxin domain
MLLLGVILLAVAVFGTATTALAAPPPTPCTLAAGTWTCELWATTGTLVLPAPGTPPTTTVPVWGYAAAAATPAQVPGPALIVNEGDTVQVILHNDLAEATSLVFPAFDLTPDLVGAPPGGTTTYSFVASRPGTSLYEAGMTANGQRQVAAGMYGGIIVRPIGAPGQAYTDASTAFDNEALLIFSEIDPNLNAAPTNYNMFQFAPRYWLINGEAYPDIDDVPVLAGQKVLLRYINAGLQQHSIGVLGLRQTLIARDGLAFPLSSTVVAETMGAGQTMDALVSIPAAAPTGRKYALTNASLHQHNAGQRLASGSLAYGGMLAFLTITGTLPTGDTGPLASAVSISPNPTTGSTGVTLTATLDETTTGGGNVVAAEYFIDTIGVSGAGTPVTGATYGSISVSVSEAISAGVLAALPSGNHTFYIHGQDALLNWGAFGSATLNLDKAGPATTAVQTNPAATFGNVEVGMHATARDVETGNSNIAAAEYFFEAAGADGTGVAMTVNTIAPTSMVSATIPLTDVMALAEGAHPIFVHSQDALGNWGPFGTVNLLIDKTGPDTTALTAAPSPNNGLTPFNPSTYAVRVTAHAADPDVAGALTNIGRVEFFIDTVGADGTGAPMTPSDGLYDTPNEDAWANIPLSTIAAMTPGVHTLYFHAKDIVGNWGPVSTIALVIDKDGPAVSGIQFAPGATATTGLLSAVATDPVNGAEPASNVAGAEWFVGADPGPGNATPMTATDGTFDSPTENIQATVDISGWASGVAQTLGVRARDALGTWGAVSTLSVARYDQTLYETNGTDFNWIGLPVNAGLAMASDLKAHIESHSSGALTVNTVQRWNPTSQNYTTYQTVPFPSGNFALAPGQAYRITVNLPAVNSGNRVWTLVGPVPDQTAFAYMLVETNGTDYNWVLLPWTKSNLTLASHLNSDIQADAVPTTAARNISRWNAASQNFTTFSPTPFPSGDFAIIVGLPYRINVNVAAPDTTSTWPAP